MFISSVFFLFLNAFPTARAADDSSFIVNIDNPDFRRLVMAIPTFEVSGTASPEIKVQGTTGAKELARLLEFSGLFNFVSEDAYSGVMKKSPIKNAKADSRGLGGVDLKQWKSIGVESLTIGKLVDESGKLTLEIRTIDINKGTLILGKRFANISNLNLVLRRYADLLLQAYTGKPGIFSTKIVFVGRRAKKSDKQIFICDFDGSNLKQITNEKTPHLSPSWSPDGKYILYTSYEQGNPDLYIYHLATGKKRKLSSYKGLNSGGVFSPGGKLIAMTGTVAGNADIYLIYPNGGKRTAFIRGSGLDVDPTFSPDGKWMAFVSGRYGNPHIFRASLDWNGAKTSVRVKGDKRLTYAGWYNATPAWSPSSEKIAFAGYDREIDRFDIFLMSADGTNLERLTLRTGDNESPTWSPNGQMIAFQSNRIGTKNIKGRAQLFMMSRDGGSQRELKTGLYEAQTPKWSPVLE